MDLHKEMSKKILFVINSLAVGGTETQLSLLAQHLVIRNFRVFIFVLTQNGELEKNLKNNNMSIIGGRYNRNSFFLTRFFQLLGAQFLLLSYCIKQKPNIVHSFLPLTNFITAPICKLIKIPYITSWRSLTHYRDKFFLFSSMDTLALRWSKAVVCNSKAVLTDLLKKDVWLEEKKTYVIYNGIHFPENKKKSSSLINLRKNLGLLKSDLGIVYVANLISYKGHIDLIDAFYSLNPREKNLKLFLVGEDRGIQKNLRALAEKYNILDQIFFLGLRNDIQDILESMDIGIMASHEEGFSNSLLEKIAAGLPVVATDVGGNKEAMKGLKGCVLVKPKNPPSLAKGLQHVIENLNHSKNSDGIDRSNKIKSQFSVEKMVQSYVRLYDTLTNVHPHKTQKNN